MINKASERKLCFMLINYNIRGTSCRAGVEVKILNKKILEKKLWIREISLFQNYKKFKPNLSKNEEQINF